jgi:hypothetical protein
MKFEIEVRSVEAGYAVPGMCHLVDGEKLFERDYERVLGLVVRSLAAQAELAQAEHEWVWADHDE